jgi:hypothetical protein
VNILSVLNILTIAIRDSRPAGDHQFTDTWVII